ncbi:MAG: L,D-transpeptidase [Sphingomonadales bacterium]|nr:MAG: L,D-transpeptidase [Sphingomonadales bacterium]
MHLPRSHAVERLKPGEYLWAPEIAPAGPVLLVVSLATQRAVLYRNGVPIGISTVSTGRKGHVTPTGIFTVLEKRAEHYSNIYDNAPMPYMHRLTWGGVALHGGHLPGYPDSHGCIRLPTAFAKHLFGATRLGMTVVVTADRYLPRLAPRISGTVWGTDDAMEHPYSWHPDRSPEGPVAIVVSGADRRVVVLRNGREIGSAPVALEAPAVGTVAYLLQSIDEHGHHWSMLSFGSGEESGMGASELFRRYKVDSEFGRAVSSIVAPGTTLVVTADTLRIGGADALVAGE